MVEKFDPNEIESRTLDQAFYEEVKSKQEHVQDMGPYLDFVDSLISGHLIASGIEPNTEYPKQKEIPIQVFECMADKIREPNSSKLSWMFVENRNEIWGPTSDTIGLRYENVQVWRKKAWLKNNKRSKRKNQGGRPQKPNWREVGVQAAALIYQHGTDLSINKAAEELETWVDENIEKGGLGESSLKSFVRDIYDNIKGVKNQDK